MLYVRSERLALMVDLRGLDLWQGLRRAWPASLGRTPVLLVVPCRAGFYIRRSVHNSLS
jgi:hypothetical protein